MTRERGVVESGRASRVQLVAHGKVVAEHREHGRVTLRRDDGSSLVIEVTPETTLDGDGVTTRGAWSELRDGTGLPRDAVQPFTEVELVRLGFDAGEQVVALGEQSDVVFGDDGGMRDAPSATPIVHAEWIGVGADADERLDAMLERRRRAAIVRPRVAKPTDPGDPRVWEWLPFETMLALVVAGTCLVLGLMMGMHRPHILLMATATAGVLAAGFATRRRVPGMWTLDGPVPVSEAPIKIAIGVCFIVTGLVVLGIDSVRVEWLLAWLAVPVGVLAMQLVSNARLYRYLGELTRAAPAKLADSVGAWLTIEGTLGAAKGGSGAQILVRSQVETRIATTSRGEDKVEGQRVLGDKAFTIVTPDGTIRVERDDIIWGSTVTNSPERSRAMRVTDEAHLVRGGQVVACGKLDKRTDGSYQLRSAGTRPAIVLATSAAGYPLALARALRRGRWLSIAALLATAAGIVGLAFRLR